MKRFKISKKLLMVALILMVAVVSVYADSPTTITDEVATKIKNANTTATYDSTKLNTLYGVGEANLTDNDVVTINGVDCYVLSVDETANTAQLITKNIYDQRFNASGSGYDYATSDLKTYMNNFYTNQLGSDSRIVDHTVTSYTKDSMPPVLSTFTTSTITQKVYALDAVEAETNANKFGSSSWIDYNEYRDSAYTNDCNGFWVSAGYFHNSDGFAFNVGYYGNTIESIINYSKYGARPAFTISLPPSTPTLTTTVNGAISSVTYSDGQLDNGGTVSGISQLKIMNSYSSNGSMWLKDAVDDGSGPYTMQFTAGYNNSITLDNAKSYRISWVGTNLCIDESLSGTPTNWTLINSLSDNITLDSNVDYANAVLFASNKTFTKENNVIIYDTKTESGTVYYEIIIIGDKISVPEWVTSVNLAEAITQYTDTDFYVIGTISPSCTTQHNWKYERIADTFNFKATCENCTATHTLGVGVKVE